MAVDARDEIWEESFGTYYDVYYEEMLTEAIINWWLVVDEVVTILIGGAVAICSPFLLRQFPNGDYKNIWVSIVWFLVFWAMLHLFLNVPERLKNHGNSLRRFLILRINLETFRDEIRINPDFPIYKFTNKFTELHQNFLNNMQLVKPDFLKIAWLEHKIKNDLNAKLQNEIQAFEGGYSDKKTGKTTERPCPKPRPKG